MGKLKRRGNIEYGWTGLKREDIKYIEYGWTGLERLKRRDNIEYEWTGLENLKRRGALLNMAEQD